MNNCFALLYSKTCVKRPLSKRSKTGFQDQLSLNACQKYCRMLQGEDSAILLPSLSYHLSLRFLSGRLTQVLLYVQYHILLKIIEGPRHLFRMRV